ncbi:MAG: mucoidy inhibitor MuiA family protein [Halothiobacillus sp.]|jgi:uncharacterized protein (TIGR02231 family)|nr:mucoidy inhibitor MuiA family protein [Halothiobacillus sp.]
MSEFTVYKERTQKWGVARIRVPQTINGMLLLVALLTGMPVGAANVPATATTHDGAADDVVSSVVKSSIEKPKAVVAVAQATKLIARAGKISAVTVLPDGAWVTRQLDVPWPAPGMQILQVTDLPRDIEQGSVQVQSEAMTLSAPMQWHDLPVEASVDFHAIEQQIEVLKKQLAKASDELLAARTRLSIFQAQMAAPLPEKKHGYAIGAFLTDTKARDRFDRLLVRLLDSRRHAQNAVDGILQQIKAAEQKQDQMRQKGPSLMLALPLALDAAQKTPTKRVVQIRYRVKDAHWVPIYRVDLETSFIPADKGASTVSDTVTTTPQTPSVLRWSLVAEVNQTTGESWQDIPVTLSLLDTHRYYPVPKLDQWIIGFTAPSKPGINLRANAARHEAVMATKSSPFTSTDETGFNAEFRSVAPVTITSTTSATIIPLLQHEFSVETTDLITPSISPLAILSARFTLNNTTPLPAGVWQLFLNGSQIGRVHEPSLGPMKKMALSFGVDRRIEVTVDRPADQRDENGLIGKSQQLIRRRVISVQSQHQQPMPVTILMNLPVAEDADLAVDPLADNTPPSNKQYDGKDGVWAWSNQIKPGQKITINFGFRLRWPADKNLYGF